MPVLSPNTRLSPSASVCKARACSSCLCDAARLTDAHRQCNAPCVAQFPKQSQRRLPTNLCAGIIALIVVNVAQGKTSYTLPQLDCPFPG